MQTPLERAARALARMDGKDPDAISKLKGVPNWRRYRPRAFAALKAIREPSEAMIEAGSSGGDWPHSKETWQAMLDTAIKGE